MEWFVCGVAAQLIFNLPLLPFIDSETNLYSAVFFVFTLIWVYSSRLWANLTSTFMMGIIFSQMNLFGQSSIEVLDANISSYSRVLSVSRSLEIALVRPVGQSEEKEEPRYFLVRNKNCKNKSVVKLTQYGVKCPNKNYNNQYFYDVLRPEETHATGWIYAVFTGDKQYLSYFIKSIMRDFGLLHMCAVSGFHLAIVLFFARFTELTWGVTEYGLKRVGIDSVKFNSERIIFSLKLMLIFMWLYLIGFKASAIRASICYFVSNLRLDSEKSWMLGMSLFCLISPLDLVSFSSLLSWLSYIVIVSVFTNSSEDGAFRIKRLLICHVKSQVILGGMSLIIVGEVSALSFVGNLLLLPLLTLYLKLIIAILLIFPHWWYLKCSEIFDLLAHKFYILFEPIFSKYSVIINIYELDGFVTVCIGAAFLIFLLKSLNIIPRELLR